MSTQTQTHVCADGIASTRTQTRIQAGAGLPTKGCHALMGHIKAWLGSHQKGSPFFPFSVTNSKAWPCIVHSCLPRLWLVEVGAINFASMVLLTCKEVKVIFILQGDFFNPKTTKFILQVNLNILYCICRCKLCLIVE